MRGVSLLVFLQFSLPLIYISNHHVLGHPSVYYACVFLSSHNTSNDNDNNNNSNNNNNNIAIILLITDNDIFTVIYLDYVQSSLSRGNDNGSVQIL